jgi:peptide deformylase
MVRITKDGEAVLRDTAKDVPLESISTPEIQKLLKDMSAALATEKYGVAIAAPQVGKSLRIFVVSGKVLRKESGNEGDDRNGDFVFINPTILKTSKKMQHSHESCLSIQGRPAAQGPDVAGIVARPEKMLISAYDAAGVKMERGASGFLAAIFDHEIDHLNGILFIDKTIDRWEIDENFNRVG